MIAKEITGNIISQQYSDGKLNVSITFDWFETDKKRMRKVAEDGTEFGIMVGKTIKDGDVLAETEDKRYFARIKTAQLIEIPVNSMKEMGRGRGGAGSRGRQGIPGRGGRRPSGCAYTRRR